MDVDKCNKIFIISLWENKVFLKFLKLIVVIFLIFAHFCPKAAKKRDQIFGLLHDIF